MARISKIVTKTGDGGQTGLGDGERVKKYNLRVQAYGEVDEANSAIGLSLSLGASPKEYLQVVQNDLFDIGGDLCFPESKNKKFIFSEKRLGVLEKKIKEILMLHLMIKNGLCSKDFGKAVILIQAP